MNGQINVININFLNSSETEELEKVKATMEMQRKKQEEAEKAAQLDTLLHTLRNMAYRDIVDITMAGKAPLAIFLLCTCLLEQMATYRYGSNGKIRKFIDEYMPQYDGEVMHKMRNKINHNYSLHEKYALTIRTRNAHLAITREGAIMINMENFVEELGVAFEKFANDLNENKSGIRNNALTVLRSYGILSHATIDIVIPDSTGE